MTQSDLNQGFPQLQLPMVNSGGFLTIPWYRLLVTLWNRTGGASSQNAVAGTYSGELRSFAANGAVPSGWLVCDGSAVSRATYSNLFAAIGTTWGSGDGSSTFNLPDFNNKFMLGTGSGNPVGASGGSSTHTLSTSNLPAHNHTVIDPGHNHSISDPTHSHTVTDPTHHHTSLVAASNVTTGSGAGGTTTGNTGNAATGLTINPSSTGISVLNAMTGITTADTGSGNSFSIVPPYGTVVVAIKT